MQKAIRNLLILVRSYHSRLGQYIHDKTTIHGPFNQSYIQPEKDKNSERVRKLNEILEYLTISRSYIQQSNNNLEEKLQGFYRERVSTLENLARYSIKKHSLKPTSFMMGEVLNQPIESEEHRHKRTRRGGKRKKTLKSKGIIYP
jgi:hypothetical protein